MSKIPQKAIECLKIAGYIVLMLLMGGLGVFAFTYFLWAAYNAGMTM